MLWTLTFAHISPSSITDSSKRSFGVTHLVVFYNVLALIYDDNIIYDAFIVCRPECERSYNFFHRHLFERRQRLWYLPYFSFFCLLFWKGWPDVLVVVVLAGLTLERASHTATGATRRASSHTRALKNNLSSSLWAREGVCGGNRVE